MDLTLTEEKILTWLFEVTFEVCINATIKLYLLSLYKVIDLDYQWV